MTEVSYPIAFGAGIAAFVSPCVLPLVPIYIANLGGIVSLSAEAKRRNIILHTISFVIGFSIVYTILGAAVGLFGPQRRERPAEDRGDDPVYRGTGRLRQGAEGQSGYVRPGCSVQ